MISKARPSSTEATVRRLCSLLWRSRPGTPKGAVKLKHRRHASLSFLSQIDRAYPDQELRLVMDNSTTHKIQEVRNLLAAHPRLHVHLTRPPNHGLTWWKSGSVSLTGKRLRGRFHLPKGPEREDPGVSPVGTTGSIRSRGRRRLTRSWRERSVYQRQTRDTSGND